MGRSVKQKQHYAPFEYCSFILGLDLVDVAWDCEGRIFKIKETPRFQEQCMYRNIAYILGSSKADTPCYSKTVYTA